jgi:hypothetical protein
VIRSGDGVEVAKMALDEWVELSAVEFAAADAVRQALYTAQEAARHLRALSAEEAAASRTAARAPKAEADQ